MKRVGILISGRGSNMRALVEATQSADYPAEIACVIANVPGAGGLEIARNAGIPAITVDHKQFDGKAAFEAALSTELQNHQVDLICLAGFMRLLSADFVTHWHNRILNIHPSLLPAYKGLDTHARALADGVPLAGCSVHVVRAEMDDGPIVAQAAVRTRSDDTVETLTQRVLKAEHKLYPLALSLFASGQVTVDDERIIRHGQIATTATGDPDILIAP